MKAKFINWNKTGEAKSKYGAGSVVIEQETKYGIQYILTNNESGSMKYEKVYNSNDTDTSEIDGEELEYSDLENEVEQNQEMNSIKKEDNYIDLSFGKIVNGKGSFIKGLAKTTGLKFAYEVTKQMKKSNKMSLKSISLLSGLKEARIELKDDLKELGIKQTQFYDRKGLQQALNTLKRKGELKTLQRLIKFNLDFDKKGSNTLIKLLKIKDPRVLSNELNKKGLGKKEVKQLVTTSLSWKTRKGKK